MFFTVYNNAKVEEDLFKVKVKHAARRKILLYPMRTCEQLLDRELKQTYKIGLKQMCLLLLNKSTMQLNSEGDITIMFKSTELDNVASLITYGKEKLPGSKILRNAFTLT